MELTLLKIRFKQLSRELDDLGIFYGLFYLGLSIVAILVTYKLYQDPEKAWIPFAGVIAGVFFIHNNRKDRQFVFLHVKNPLRTIFTEYLVFTLPFTLPCLLSKQYYYFPIILLLLFLISTLHFKFKLKTPQVNPSLFINAKNFELISGMRKHFWGFVFIYLLSISFCWLSFLPLFFLWVLTTVLISFYQECESLNVLKVGGGTAASFLKNKILSQSKFLVLILAPVLLVNLFFNFEYWYVNIIFLFLQLLVLVFAILYKYTVYEPNKDFSGSAVIVSIVSFSGLIPFLLPIPLIMCIRNYPKAIKNLKTYIHA
ncbi:MAG: hypothetical protein M3Q58_16630 [Bacteroidota bacterium]|nr:hypothetical protein [Bacteroidota bacterium]